MFCEHCGHDWHGQPCQRKIRVVIPGGRRLETCPCTTSYEEKS